MSAKRASDCRTPGELARLRDLRRDEKRRQRARYRAAGLDCCGRPRVGPPLKAPNCSCAVGYICPACAWPDSGAYEPTVFRRSRLIR